MKNDYLLYLCAECGAELEKSEVFYYYGHVVCAPCLYSFAEDARELQDFVRGSKPIIDQ